MRIEISEIGSVLLQKRKRARNLNIHVSPFDGVKVTIPVWVSYKDAEDLVSSKKDWILKQVKKMDDWTRENAVSPDLPFDVDDNSIKDWLIGKTKDFTDKYGFQVGRITIRDQRTRWGSCSPANNISLNRKLAWIPDELVDYVILHELVHTKVKNHGKEFWKALDDLVGDAKGIDKRLRDYHLELL